MLELKRVQRIETPRNDQEYYLSFLFFHFTMLVFGLERIPRFLIATSLLVHISETAHLQCTKSMFSLRIANNSPYFLLVALRITPPFFSHYVVTNPGIFNWRIPLKKICKVLREGIACSSMVFTVYNHNPPGAVLTFHDSCKYLFLPNSFSQWIFFALLLINFNTF